MLLKNEGDVICERSEKPKVYVPVKYTPAQAAGATGNVASGATMEVPIDADAVADLLDVVTDAVADPSGEADEDGNPTYQDSDLTRLTADEVADCDFAVVFVDSPSTGVGAITNEDGSFTYIPKSLQYREYVADGANVRQTSLAGDPADGSYWADHDFSAAGVEIENRSYYGQSTTAENESDLDLILSTVDLMAGKPVVVVINASTPMAFSEFEDKVQGIIMHFGAGDLPLADIIGGKVEPSGLLPLQQPASMDAVEAQQEDVPRDMECHVATYAKADPLTEPETVSIQI